MKITKPDKEMKTEFHYAFQINRLTIFEVDYYTLGDNRHPYFTTSAKHFVRSKRGVDRAGQCQEHVLSGRAKAFWKKWDELHLKDLTDEEYNNLRDDLEVLKQSYEYIVEERDTFAGTNWYFTYSQIYELSMRPLKKAGR